MTRTVRHARVLITGAASGMGLLYAERAVAEGARSVVLWDVDAPSLDRVASELRRAATGRTTVHPYAVDLREPLAIAEVAAAVRAEVGAIDVLINNAGIVTGRYFWEHDTARNTVPTVQVNALAPMIVTGEFLDAMIAGTRPARIVNIASAAGLFSTPRMSVYAASKAAVIGWSDSLRLELKRSGIRHVTVTTVAPSYVSTGMFDGARAPLLTPIMSPAWVVDRVWRAMLRGTPLLMLPWSVRVAKIARGVLPIGMWDRMADSVFHIYGSMEDFTGR